MGISLTPEEQFHIFGENFSPDWEREAEERWGDTDAWRQSRTRTAAYTKQDWTDIKAETAAIEAGFVEAMRAGDPPTSSRAQELAEAHRRHIDSRFYDCDPGMHRALAQMYLGDARFTKHFDDKAPGLARYVHDAILANGERRADRGLS